MNIKSILLAAAVGLTTLGVVPEAKAEPTCRLYQDFSLCMEMVDRQGSYNTWDLNIINRYWTESMKVVCNNNTMHTWSSTGGASQSEANQIAIGFCAL